MNQTTENGITVLRSDPGKAITDKSERTLIAHELYLGVGDSPDNYEEIDEPIEEANALEEYEITQQL